MNYIITNCAPDSDTISIHLDDKNGKVSITIGRDENGEVHVQFVDNKDNYKSDMILGKESNPIQFGSIFIEE